MNSKIAIVELKCQNVKMSKDKIVIEEQHFFEVLTKDGEIFEYLCSSKNEAYELHHKFNPNSKIAHISRVFDKY